jgi:pimeloyl-ACP methyl ester carboxylesterase
MEKIHSKDGTLIAYEKDGSGPALVLVHGTAADHTRWDPILLQLRDKFTVYAVDRRGRGESGDNLPYSIEREFEDIAAVVESISEPVNLLGHSFGAICSLEAAWRVGNLNRLILYEPPINFTDQKFYPAGFIDTINLQLEAGDLAGVAEIFLREIPRVPPRELELLKASPSWQGRVAAAHTIPRELQASDAGYRFDAADFAEMNTPTLLLLGGDSPDFFGEAIYQLHDALPHNKVVVMPGQQHVAMNSAPELFLRQVLGFLEGEQVPGKVVAD